MELKEFEEIFNTYLKELKICMEKEEVEQFYNYMKLLLEWNENINLTAITEPKEVIIKHFIDSLTDAFKDSINLVPFLFVIFVFIEVFEQFFSHKINTFLKLEDNCFIVLCWFLPCNNANQP